MERAPQHLMRNLASVSVVFALTSAVVVSNASAQEGSRRAASGNPHTRAACGDVLSFQVLLDGHGFSAGEIDGRLGTNTRRALEAFQEANQLKTDGNARLPDLVGLRRQRSNQLDNRVHDYPGRRCRSIRGKDS